MTVNISNNHCAPVSIDVRYLLVAQPGVGGRSSFFFQSEKASYQRRSVCLIALIA